MWEDERGRAGHEAELLGVFVLGDDEKGYWTGTMS